MTGTAAPTIWTLLRRAWLAAGSETPMDPRLAEEAGVQAQREARTLSPLVGAYLR